MSRKSLSGLILLGVFAAGLASSSAVSAAGEPSTFASGNIETEENAEKELGKQVESSENSGDESTVDGSENIENETNLAEETIKEDGSNNTEPEEYVYIDDKTKEQQAPAKGGKGSGVSLAKGMIGAGVAALGISGAAAGIKVGLSKGEPEPDNPQPEPGKEEEEKKEEEKKEEEKKEEEKKNGLSIGAIAGIAVGGVIVVVVVVSYLIYFHPKYRLKSKLLGAKNDNEKAVNDFVDALKLGTIVQFNNEIDNNDSFAASLARLIDLCNTAKLVALVEACGAANLAVLVAMCDANKLVALAEACDANSLASLPQLMGRCNAENLAKLVKCKEFDAQTLAKKLNGDKNFINGLIGKLKKYRSNTEEVWNWINEYDNGQQFSVLQRYGSFSINQSGEMSN